MGRLEFIYKFILKSYLLAITRLIFFLFILVIKWDILLDALTQESDETEQVSTADILVWNYLIICNIIEYIFIIVYLIGKLYETG